ncbi:Cubilin [Trachymyrmex cornetzi]|uniref:Cubilin n=1 Tax=Trachymyrmex cornetzi TaxID=471704 RepID=A0A151J4L5_9HYME|nr:Cubilin [Trachymyrmex cornetzi]
MASVLWHVSGNSFLSPIFVLLLLLCPHNSTECDQKFVSTPDGPLNGSFYAPTLINPEGEPRQCVYTFLAGPRQRVELTFTSFGLRGKPPDGSAVGELPACIHEYLDIYSEIRSENTTKLIETPFGGRFCGPIPPRRRVSLYQGIALSFYTDKNVTFPNIFSGIYRFINASEYEVGTPEPSTPCTFTIHAEIKRNGNILSPTYPGTYPKDLICSYQFVGHRGQRVRLEFRDFDLFFGGPHCPLDYVKVYDGPDNSTAVIGTYCGQQRNLVLYSSENSLFVLFSTLRRTANTQNRGFKGIFEFSESFVSLDFITEYQGEHIRGSECDQKILSKKETSGFVVSPNFPYPYLPKVVCRYFIYGMQDSQHLERVRLEFQVFTIQMPKGETSCTDGYLKLYLKGQEATDSYDKFDYEMCGNNSNPSHIVSDGPRLVMVFSSGELQAQGFKAKYIFETEYKIPGTAAPDGSCTFTYRSSSRKRGEFNSPRYPSNYPSDTNCTYFFLATPDEQVALIFDHFKVRTRNDNVTVGYYGHAFLYRGEVERNLLRLESCVPLGREEDNYALLLLVILIFLNHYAIDCGSNISSLNYGIITSPNFPNNYDGPAKNLASKSCNWFIRVRPDQRILLNFEVFSVEGDQLARGCPAAVLRMWYSSTPRELCGVKDPNAKWDYLSEDHNMRLSFISADKAVGQQGFRAVWTEVSTNTDCENQFLCSKSKYCINESLRCNNIDNCGPDDSSDEENCVTVVPADSYTMPIVYAISSILVIMMLCLICHHRLRRRSRNISINDLPQQQIVDDQRHCYQHHDLLHHQHQNHTSTHSFNQYQLEQSSLPSESDEDEAEEPEPCCDQESSSPDSV